LTVRKAVVLAAGRGTRMRASDGAASLSIEQQRAADAGAKAMMPFGRPFLDYVLSALADAGINEIAIVVAPDDVLIRKRYGVDVALTRTRITFAEQREPRGTANALLAARAFAGSDPFLMLNADNYYSVSALRALADAPGPALAGYRADALVRRGNIPIDRIRSFALLKTDAHGNLKEIVEKPDPNTAAAFGAGAPVSMNLWSFTNPIFGACARVTPSPRGELELADAVRIAMRDFDLTFRVVPVDDGVLDLSSRADVASVAARLADVTVQL
jgi:glucose-1-phosphate thymidylyltransferase